MESKLLRTQQAAELLGVSSSTIKRWVDSGELKAIKTLGGHRLLPQVEVESFARARGMGLRLYGEGREVRSGGQGGLVLPEGDGLVAGLLSHLRGGRGREARAWLAGAYEKLGAVELADEVIRPLMVAIGHEWESGDLDIFQEHRATRVIKEAVFEILFRIEENQGDESRPLAMGAAMEGDPYMLPGMLCELTLREMGWNVMNLGVNLPMKSLAPAMESQRPQLIWISVSHVVDEESFARDFQQFYSLAKRRNIPVIMGGQVLGLSLQGRVVATGFGSRMAHLAEFARQFLRLDSNHRSGGYLEGSR